MTASVRLAAFIFPQYAAMMQTDEMDLTSLGERKRAIFCVIPVNDGSMNYLVSMLFTQCFQQLYLRADERYNGRLPIPVRVIQDEWANVAQPDSYPKVLATCRSYNIGINTAVLLPFKTQEIMDTGGLYYGVNAVSRNLIICNRDALLNGHGLYLGVSGSGKSMMAKQEIGFVGLNTDHDIIVVDPEREYGPLIRALGGEVITISASNGSYVNALDISKEYGDGRNPLVLKSEFIMSLCEQLMGAGEIGAKEKSIIDRCTANIYRKYIRKYEGDPPTLKDLYDDLMRQKEPVAHEIALALELFTTGSLNVFAHQTNIDTRNRIICYDIQDLGENLKPIGLLVMLDSILNRVIRNRQQGRYTHVYIDEIYLFFASPGVGGKSAINNYSSEFLYKCWKRFRKYYATLTGITQNVEECLLSDTARLMFANSEFLVLLNQAPTDRAELAKLLDASDAQMDYVSDAPAGHGLIKVGSCLVPFINELPRDTELYRLMTTKPGEQNA